MTGRYSSLVVLSLAMLAGTQVRAQSPPCDVNTNVEAPDWLKKCEAAIARETDARRRAPLLFGRAAHAVRTNQLEAAVPDLDAALTANPDNPAYLLARSYVHSELLNLELANADLDHLVSLAPDDATVYLERADVRHYRGDLKGAYEDSSRAFELSPKSAEAMLARANSALWLGKFDDAKADATHATKLAKSAGNEELRRAAADQLAHIELWRNTTPGGEAAALCKQEVFLKTGGTPQIIGDCSRVFLDARTSMAKADALSARAAAWPGILFMIPQGKSTEDLRLALAFDPKSAARHINLGFSFLGSALLNHAIREFDRAQALEPHWEALVGRANARKHIGDQKGAMADALAANKLQPNEETFGLLADLAYESGDLDRARELYLQVYRLGSRSPDLMEQLKDLGVMDPDEALKK